MPKIPATETTTFRVKTPIDEVYSFLLTPSKLQNVMNQLEKCELIGDNQARWVLEEKNEKGIKFQPDYTVEYSGNGTDHAKWKTVKGNMDINGEAKLRKISDDVTEVEYKETMAPDLPINKLMAKVFKPIVARNVKQGITEYINRIKQELGGL